MNSLPVPSQVRAIAAMGAQLAIAFMLEEMDRLRAAGSVDLLVGHVEDVVFIRDRVLDLESVLALLEEPPRRVQVPLELRAERCLLPLPPRRAVVPRRSWPASLRAWS